jgi:hypothetical protein
MEKVPTINGHLWIPVDDYTSNVYNFMYSYDPAIPITREYALELETAYGRGPDDMIPGTYRLKKNASNDYLIDRDLQLRQTYTGIVGVNTQDFALQEGMGPIVDRSQERLGTSDRAIIATRQLLLEATYAAEKGEPVRGTDSSTYNTIRAIDRTIPLLAEWREALKDELVARF